MPMESYNRSPLTTKVEKLQKQQEDLKNQVKALMNSSSCNKSTLILKLDKLQKQYEDLKNQTVSYDE